MKTQACKRSCSPAPATTPRGRWDFAIGLVIFTTLYSAALLSVRVMFF